MLINPRASVTSVTLNDYEILICDDFYQDVDSVRASAVAADYRVSYSTYPGLHCPIPDDQTLTFKANLPRFLTCHGVPTPEPLRCDIDFAVVTTPESKLRPRQRIPHIDNVPLFCLIYLSDTEDSYTCFFRHRPTGLLILNAKEDREQFGERRRNRTESNEQTGYDISSHPDWAEVARVNGRYNRMVCYPGFAFHSMLPGDVPQPFVVSRARITQRVALSTARSG